MLRELIRQAEVYLECQLVSGIASDQRASSFSSMLGAALAALAAGASALALSSPLFVAPLVPAIFGFTVAIRRAISASEPTNFEFRGNTPSGWIDDVKSKKPLSSSLAEPAAHYADGIQLNGEILARNCELMKSAVQWAWRSFVSSLLIAAVVVPGKLIFDSWDSITATFCGP
jgi:hypothetical protein